MYPVKPSTRKEEKGLWRKIPSLQSKSDQRLLTSFVSCWYCTHYVCYMFLKEARLHTHSSSLSLEFLHSSFLPSQMEHDSLIVTSVLKERKKEREWEKVKMSEETVSIIVSSITPSTFEGYIHIAKFQECRFQECEI